MPMHIWWWFEQFVRFIISFVIVGYSFRLVDRLRSWRSLLNQTETEAVSSEELDFGLLDGKSILSQDSPEGLSDSVSNNVVSGTFTRQTVSD